MEGSDFRFLFTNHKQKQNKLPTGPNGARPSRRGINMARKFSDLAVHSSTSQTSTNLTRSC